MRTTAQVSDGQFSEKQARILDYLRRHVDRRTYFKSRLIGADLGLSSNEVGTNMTSLARSETGLTIEKWGYSSATTWMVTA